jgi:hypothetical protein
MANFNGLRAFACLALLTLAAFVRSGAAHAADAGPVPGPGPGAGGGAGAAGYAGYFYPAIDPRCRIVPMPEASLYGDTTRMVPTAVCQSRGLYADSVLFW